MTTKFYLFFRQVYDNMSVSTTNTSATTRNYNVGGDADSNFLKMIPGLKEVQEAEQDEKKLPKQSDKPRTSMFVENSDILNDQNYPKLYYRHSTFLLPTTAKHSRSIDEALREKQMEKRRYSDTKLHSSLHFENEFLVKNSAQGQDAFGSPTKYDVICDQLETNIQNILEMDAGEHKKSPDSDGDMLDTKKVGDKRQLFKSLPNLEMKRN